MGDDDDDDDEWIFRDIIMDNNKNRNIGDNNDNDIRNSNNIV